MFLENIYLLAYVGKRQKKANEQIETYFFFTVENWL